MKIRLEFEKNIRYISHLELMKAMGKILKRAELPLKYSNGYNPHIVLSVANPIPVGVCGKSEFADFELTKDMSEEEIFSRLQKASPNGILIKKLHIDCEKSFNFSYKAFYEIEIRTSCDEKLLDFFNKSEINVEKKAKGKIKTINLRDYIYEISLEKNEENLCIKCVLACGQSKNLNPMLIRKALLEEGIEVFKFLPVRLDVADENDEDFRR